MKLTKLLAVTLLTTIGAFGAECASYGTLDKILAAGACTVGKVEYSSFSYGGSRVYSAPTEATVLASAVTVSSSVGPTGVTLVFTAPWVSAFSLYYLATCVGCQFSGTSAGSATAGSGSFQFGDGAAVLAAFTGGAAPYRSTFVENSGTGVSAFSNTFLFVRAMHERVGGVERQ